jgi:structural maintenance of chromosome 3 (chondroitin sulfate proteoglycan 6)
LSCITEAEREHDSLSKQLQESRTALERAQVQQAEDNKAFSKQQKADEKYHTKKTLLTDRKGDADRDIRDLGVLPEEAFKKYIDVNLDKVFVIFESAHFKLMESLGVVG